MEKIKGKNSSLNFPLLKIGNFIKEARLSRNQSVSELATDLKISIQQLKAIEEGREDLLPESVFVKAMIKRISERLKLETSFIESELDKPNEKLKIEEIIEEVLVDETEETEDAEQNEGQAGDHENDQGEEEKEAQDDDPMNE